MRFYSVDPPRMDFEAEGEDHREWFTSRIDATRRARAIANEFAYDSDVTTKEVEIRVVTISLSRPTTQIVLEVLNRVGLYGDLVGTIAIQPPVWAMCPVCECNYNIKDGKAECPECSV